MKDKKQTSRKEKKNESLHDWGKVLLFFLKDLSICCQSYRGRASSISHLPPPPQAAAVAKAEQAAGRSPDTLALPAASRELGQEPGPMEDGGFTGNSSAVPQCWARPTPGAWNSLWAAQVGGRGLGAWATCCCFLNVVQGAGLQLEQPGLEPVF